MGNRYVYSDLNTPYQNSNLGYDASHSFIRLVDLSPGSNDEELYCHIRHSPLKNGIKYEALSYTWGSPDRVHKIQCGEDYLQITITLKEALLALRLPGKRRTLWIDQLCINQEDIQERNSQVKIMHLIYKHASRTVIFLG
ncbi:HET-domain-containing protein, partial [Plenodomus tracheiphilus IPT5]